jgi:hypothetical protein
LPNSIDNLVTSHLLKEFLRKPQIKSPELAILEKTGENWNFGGFLVARF